MYTPNIQTTIFKFLKSHKDPSDGVQASATKFWTSDTFQKCQMYQKVTAGALHIAVQGGHTIALTHNV